MKKFFAALLCLIIAQQNICAFADSDDLSLVLRYDMGSADYEYYVPESYYVSPIVKDINSDGKKEIITGNYSVSVLDAATGQLIFKVNGGKDRSTPYKVGQDVGILWDLDVKDIDSDGKQEIITSHATGLVCVLDNEGYMKKGWPRQLVGEHGVVRSFARSLEVSDLDGDGKCEIIVGASTTASENLWVFDNEGNLLDGWPQLASYQDALVTGDLKHGYSYGIFMDGVTTGDINGDGIKEIIAPTDTAYICAYDISGRLVDANSEVFGGRTWGKIALWEDEMTETNMRFNEGWGWGLTGNESRSELYKGELGHAVTRVLDIDNNGTNEVLTSAIILDRDHDRKNGTNDYETSKYMSVFVFNGDRTRFNTWKNAPDNRGTMGASLFLDPITLSTGVQSEPVVSDLDGDGTNEILLNTYDGCVHAFSITDPSKEFGGFPYKISQPGGGVYELPNAVVCVDVDADGKKEVIFTTNTDNEKHKNDHGIKGSLYVLAHDGTLLLKQALPDGYKTYETQLPAFTNCSLSRPVVDDIDRDGDFEVVVNTKYAGVCVYDIVGSTANVTALPTSAKVIVNGKQVNVESYNINGYNYFKLRDVAILVNGTDRQFGVGYSEALKAVTIEPGAEYVPVGGELASGDKTTKNAVVSTFSIVNRSAASTYIPYLIDGNNYFKLRDICSMAGITVEWDDKERLISIISE